MILIYVYTMFSIIRSIGLAKPNEYNIKYSSKMKCY